MLCLGFWPAAAPRAPAQPEDGAEGAGTACLYCESPATPGPNNSSVQVK